MIHLFSIKAKGLCLAVCVAATLSCTLHAQDTIATDQHEWVDLGLSVNWATTNIGTDSPEQYGTYFAWAETSGKDKYTASECRTDWRDEHWLDENGYILWCNSHPGDQSAQLAPAHDAAQTLWGDGWRMPSVREFRELCNNTSITPEYIDDVFGWRLTSKVNGYTDRSIFIPANGYKGRSPEDEGDGSEAGIVTEGGENAYFWTRDYFPTDDVTGRTWIISGPNGENSRWYDDYRFYGFGVRPVHAKTRE